MHHVLLLHSTPLNVADIAIGTCWNKHGDNINFDRLDRVVNKFKHESTIEHIYFTFYISGISRAVLQELARHRISSFSVKSSRYTLKELKDENSFIIDIDNRTADLERVAKYCVLTENEDTNFYIAIALDNLRTLIQYGISNDIAKYALPESYKTELTWTINARSLRNFLRLRLDKSALWEIRELANTILNTIPDTYSILFKEFNTTSE